MNTLHNPFRIEGVVEPPFFTDRAGEVARIRRTLESPPSKLLVYGERRMGKTSALHVARLAVERAGGRVVFADLSTASSPADMANRVLDAATRAVGRDWRDFLKDLTDRLRLRLQLIPDPATGLAIPTVEAELRSRAVEEQVTSFVGVLDALNAMAGDRGEAVGLVLDEFQELHRFGGDAAEWQLRGSVQHHGNVAYVLAGSDASLIRGMLGEGRALYELFDPLPFGPMDPAHLARWIDERMTTAGVEGEGLGSYIMGVAGPRTRDAVRIARTAFEEAVGSRDPGEWTRRSLHRIVAEEDDRMRFLWDDLTEHQQNVLRAVAWNRAGLTSRETLDAFALGHGGTARNTALALMKRGLLREGTTRVGYVYDSPFARAWVIRYALPDVGLRVAIDHT